MPEDLNLWESLLRENSKRSKIPEGNVLFVGELSCKKNSLLEKFCVSVPQTSVSNSGTLSANTELISYKYVNVNEIDDSQSDLDASNRIHLWALNEFVFKNALDLVFKPEKQERVELN